MIKLAAILAVTFLSQLSSAATPNSCYWCVSTGQIWNNIDKTCSMTNKGENTAEQCTALPDNDYRIDYAVTEAFGLQNKFVGPIYNGKFDLPYQNDDQRRSVLVAVGNIEDGLDLQLIITCDSSQVVGYSILTDVSFDPSAPPSAITTTKYSCGDKVRIQQNKAGGVILIQNTGSSTVSYELQRYVSFWSTPGGIATIVGIAVGGLILIGLGIFFYRRHKAKKLKSNLAEEGAALV